MDVDWRHEGPADVRSGSRRYWTTPLRTVGTPGPPTRQHSYRVINDRTHLDRLENRVSTTTTEVQSAASKLSVCQSKSRKPPEDAKQSAELPENSQKDSSKIRKDEQDSER